MKKMTNTMNQLKKKVKIQKLPSCIPLEMDKNGQEIRARIPIPFPPQKSEDHDLTKAMTDPPESESLLEQHMERWAQVRRHWKNAYAQNEQRYSDSLNFLKAMFEN
jgi:hypothetical protein